MYMNSGCSAFVPQPPAATVIHIPASWSFSTPTRHLVLLRATFDKELGAQPPLGFFDPLGLVADGDADKFDRYRYCEIKHGRIAMLAILGYIVQETGARLPGTYSSYMLRRHVCVMTCMHLCMSWIVCREEGQIIVGDVSCCKLVLIFFSWLLFDWASKLL